MYNRILFLARKNDLYSEKLTKYLKKISQSVKIHYSSRVNEKIKKIFLMSKKVTMIIFFLLGVILY